MRGVPVIPCRVCGVDTITGICSVHERAQRRARRHPGYDDPRYRAARAARVGTLCEACHLLPGAVLHHRDGDPAHNVESNFAWLCERDARAADEQMRTERAARLGLRRGKPSPWK